MGKIESKVLLSDLRSEFWGSKPPLDIKVLKASIRDYNKRSKKNYTDSLGYYQTKVEENHYYLNDFDKLTHKVTNIRFNKKDMKITGDVEIFDTEAGKLIQTLKNIAPDSCKYSMAALVDSLAADGLYRISYIRGWNIIPNVDRKPIKPENTEDGPGN